MRLSFGQLILFIVCLLSALLLDFYLGARFGPEMLWGISLDRSHNDGLLPDDISEQELNDLLQESSSKVTFHDVLEGKRGEAIPLKEIPISEPSVAVQKVEAKKEELSKKTLTHSVALTPVVIPPSPIVLPKKEGLYTLQIGSFGDVDQAQALKNQFESRGYSVIIKEKNIPGKGIWYHVTIGHFSSSEEAEKNKEELYEKFHTLPMVIKLSQ